MTLHVKMAMPVLQWLIKNCYLIKNVKDTVIFLTRKVYNSKNFFIASYQQELRHSLPQRNRK